VPVSVAPVATSGVGVLAFQDRKIRLDKANRVTL
jgi:hypothetical protein